MAEARFELELTDFSKYKGEIFIGDWNNIPCVAIKSLKFSFLNRQIILKNYEAYNILVERASVMGGKQNIIKIFIIGRGKVKSDVYHYDFIKMRVFQTIKPRFQEFNSMVVSGWKHGVVNKQGESICI